MDKEIFCELLNPVNTEAYSVKNLSLFPLLFRNIVLCFISVKSIFALNSRNKCFTYPAYFFQNPLPSLPTQPNPTYHQSCTAKPTPPFGKPGPRHQPRLRRNNHYHPTPYPSNKRPDPPPFSSPREKHALGSPSLSLSQAQSRPILPIRHTLPRCSKT